MKWSEKYQDCLLYIDSYWDKITHKPTRKKINHHLITIPYPFITPNDKKFHYIFYWDSFFMFRGLMDTKREHLLKDMVNNFAYLFAKHEIIPNFNAPSAMGRSQPPFFTSMILDTYSSARRKKNPVGHLVTNYWLRNMISLAKKEYLYVWLDFEGNYHHRVPGWNLARYGDRDIGYAHSSEIESGWDFTSRFYNRCDEFLAIDLNAYLYKYEQDFAFVARFFKKYDDEVFWKKKMLERKYEINRYLWNEKEGFFYDYSYTQEKQSSFLSLAGFTPLWAGLATAEQAYRTITKIPFFESDYGLFITAQESLAPKIDLSYLPENYRPAILDVLKHKQWDYPNIWSPLEYLTVIGLLRYGFLNDAVRIMQKSVHAHASLFRRYGTFFEKIDGETGDKAGNYHYFNQEGFGWTNAVFYRYIQILDSIEEMGVENIYQKPKPNLPPFTLSIPH